MKALEESLLRRYISLQTEYYINKAILYPGLAWKADFFTFKEFEEDFMNFLIRKYKTPETNQVLKTGNSVAKASVKVVMRSEFCLHKGIPYNQEIYTEVIDKSIE